MQLHHRALAAALLALIPALVSAADVGVTGTRLVVVGRGTDLRKGKVIFEVMGDAGIAKGPAPATRQGDPGLSGTLHVYYTDSPGHLTGRWVLPAPWKKNRGKVARFKNRGAPEGPSTVESVTVKDGKVISVVAKGLGDEGAVANLGVGAPSARGGVKVVLTIHNANDGSTHRMCTRFATAAGSQVRYTVGPRGRKLVATGGVADDCAADIAGAAAPECEGLNGASCLLPYPSSRFLVPANTPTGFRLRIPQAGVPHVNGEPFSAALLNDVDGFSPGVQILMHFPQGVDPERSNASRLLPAGCCGQPPGPPWTDTRTYTGRSREPDSPTVLLDADTGERVLHFIEPDARAANNPPRQALFMRPARLLTPGHHYVVAMRNLVSPSGAAVIAEPAFAALRDDVLTDVPAIEGRRADMEARVFAPLATAGIARHDLVLAFDFVVQSDFGLTFQMLSMRDQAFAWLGAIEADPSQLSFTVDEVTENDCAVAGQFVWRYVRGTYACPLFLTGDLRSDTVPVMYVDTDGFPALGGITHPEYTVTIPCSAQNPEAPTRQLLLGHGLFGTGASMTATVPAVSNAVVPWTAIAAATDFRGLSAQDVAWVGTRIVGTSTSQLNNFPAFPARLRQGMINTLILARMMRDGYLNRHPAFQRADSSGVFPGPAQELAYYGASLGGIMGTYLAGLTPDIERFALDVPAVNFSCLLQRAQPFKPFDDLLLAIGIADPLEAALGIQLTHELWASAEPVSVAHHVTTDPLPGVNGPKKVLYAAAFLDKQVSNQCTEIAARTLGLPSLAGSVLTGLQEIPDQAGPLDSAYVVWHLGELDILNPAHAPFVPPLANLIPSAVCDPHPRRPTIPAAIRQIDAFLRPGGRIESVCDGPCDGNAFDERPPERCTPQ